MSEKSVQKMRKRASEFVEPGETVQHALLGTKGPWLAHSFGLLGVPFLKFRVVAVTDAALYITAATRKGKSADHDQRLPLGSTQVSTKKGPMLQYTLIIGEDKWRLNKSYLAEAENIAAAASTP